MQQSTYMTSLRFIGFVVSIFVWCLSAYFSVDGFNVQLPDMQWAGIGLALTVTAVQLIWNKAGKEAGLTIFIVGLICYVYSIGTNISGILNMQQVSMSMSFSTAFAIVLGVILDIVPEPLLVWSLVGMSFGGDFISNIMENFGYQQVQRPQQNFQPKNQQQNMNQKPPQSNKNFSMPPVPKGNGIQMPVMRAGGGMPPMKRSGSMPPHNIPPFNGEEEN